MRPVLLGMNNPLSAEARHALFPHPPGVTGHRIWQMLSEKTGCSRGQYCRAFDRRNVLDSREWDPGAAREQSQGLWESLVGREVAVLGQSTRAVLWLPAADPLLWMETHGVRWFLLPHPSGLNRWYNDELNREMAALRLEEMYRRSIS